MTGLPQKRASLHTLGCRLNQSETAIIESRLRDAGYAIVPFGEPADLGIVNTCTVTNEADAKSRKLVRAFIRANPKAYTAVIGCYAQMGRDALAEIDGVDLIVGNQEKLNVLEYVSQGKNDRPLIVRDRIDRDDFTIAHNGYSDLTRRANLKVQDGCDFMCSFCIIPFARGRARSRDFGDLLDEAKALAGGGAKELVVTGVNIGTYQHEERTIVDVVDGLDRVDGVERIRISSIEPTTIPEALFDRMADANHALLPYLHIPLQSGSNRILEAMNRRYTREEFLVFIALAEERVPGIGVGTDVLVGFPGETDEDFEDTCSALTDSPIAYAHVFKYSPRTGTASTRMEDPVPGTTINGRSAVVRRIGDGKRRIFQEKHLGTTAEVLFEQRENSYWHGYSGNYVRVAVQSDCDLTNRIERVRLRSIQGDIVVGAIDGL